LGPKRKKAIALRIVLSGRPQFWDLHCLSAYISYHVSKFHAYWSRDSRKVPEKKKEASAVKHQTAGSPSNSTWPYLSSDLVRSERKYC